MILMLLTFILLLISRFFDTNYIVNNDTNINVKNINIIDIGTINNVVCINNTVNVINMTVNIVDSYYIVAYVNSYVYDI